MKKCKYCQSEIDDKAKICPSCNKKQSKKGLIIGIVIFAIIIMGFLGGNEDTVPTSAGNQSEIKSKKEIIVIDFSTMNYNDIALWCENNSVKGNKVDEYSDTVSKGSFLSQSIKSGEKIYEGDKITITYSLGKEPTLSQKNALKSALSYLDYSAFSYTGLIKQLEFEKYSHKDAIYAVENCGADWNEQALKKGKSYLDYSSFSRQGLINQLKFEGFTQEQATYAVNQIGL